MSKEKILLHVLFGLAVVLATACQQKEQTEISNVNGEKELVLSNHISNKKVKSICEDQYGQIWIGTFRGLNKYDGSKYHQYFCVDDSLGLPDNNINCTYSDSHKRLWVTTVNGICYYNEQGKFTRVPVPRGNKNILQILEDKAGRIFFSTGFTYYQYDEKNNQLVVKLAKLEDKPTYQVSCHIDDQDIVWVRAPFMLKGYRSSNFQKVAEISLSGFPVSSYLQEGHKLWLSGYAGLQLFDTHTKKMQPLPAPLQTWKLPHDMVNLVHPYGKNALLLNTLKHGLWLLDSHQ